MIMHWRWSAGLLLSVLTGFSAADDIAMVEDPPAIIIREAHSELRDDVYYLDAHIDYRFSKPTREALDKGVPITIVLRIEIQHPRNYFWSEKIASLEQRYQLSFHALTQQYMLRNLNSGSQYSFPTLDAAVTVLSTVVDLPLIDSSLLEQGGVYTGHLLAELDVDQLPVPLRLLALISKDWQLNSEWYIWQL